MSGFDSVLESLRDAYAEIGKAEAVARDMPGDIYVLATIDALKAHAAELELAWEEACRQEAREVCRYRMIPHAGENYSLLSVTRTLNEFQQLFSRIYDSVLNGPKVRARISPDVFSKSAFEFGFSYPGSLGIVLTVQGERRLLGDKFDGALKALLQVTEVSDEFDVRDLAKTLGASVVKKAYDWAKVNYESQFDIGLRWSGVQNFDSGGLIPIKTFETLVNVISATSDKITNTVFENGTLNGIDRDRGRFNFFVSPEIQYSGSLSNEFDRSQEWTINRRYRAEVLVEEVTEYATQETKRVYQLVNLIDRSA